MHTATSGPIMLFFFTVVTVIVPVLVLAGLVIFAVRDAVKDRSERKVQDSPDGTHQIAKLGVESPEPAHFGVRCYPGS
jgi:hypothetical protein